MSSFEQTIKQAVEDRVVPPVVLIAGDKEGKLNYRQSHGTLSLDRDGDGGGGPIGPDSVLTWMSLTKLPTAVAVLQLVQRGELPSLDDAAAVATHLPELAAQPVLVLPLTAETATTPRKTPLTLRHLLTHSSGLSYPFLPGPLADLFARRGVDPLADVGSNKKVQDRFAYPLLFEPGTGWSYGPGLDWAGLLLERVVGTSLDAYLREHVWAPLGLRGDAAPTFSPPPGGGKAVATSARDPADRKSVV